MQRIPSSESTAMPLMTPRPRPIRFTKEPVVQIDKTDTRRKDKWRRLVMPQDGLISYRIEGNDGWRFLGEIRIGNVDERPESVISEIGREDDWVHVRVNTEGVDHNIRSCRRGRVSLD